VVTGIELSWFSRSSLVTSVQAAAGKTVPE
jgi:hypothetical protein